MKKELTTREVQMGSYEVLKYLSKICEDNNLRYFLTYGTLIGCIRHQGIIPWDDDIDIMMPRPDYEKLLKYLMTHNEDIKPFKIFTPEIINNYPHRIARFSDLRYRIIFDNEKDYGIGLFVDIYPLDGVGSDFDKAIKIVNKTKRYASMCFLTSRKKYSLDNTDTNIKMIFKFPAYIYAKLKGNKYYLKKLEKYAKIYDYETSKYVACSSWPVGNKYGHQRDVFRKEIFEVMYMKFEDAEFAIPKGYHEFLETTYGDYMTPPDEKGKKTHHTYKAYKLSNS